MAEDNKPVMLEQKDFDALVKKLGGDANEKINQLFGEAEKGNKQALDELKAKINDISTIGGKSIGEFVKNVQDHCNTIEAELKKTNDIQSKGVSFEKQLQNDIKAFGVDKLSKSISSKEKLELKVAIEHSLTDSVGAGVVPLQFEPGIAGVLKRTPRLYDLLTKYPWSKSQVYWVEISSEDGTIAARKEYATSLGSPFTDAKFIERSYKNVKRYMELSKIAAYAKWTEETVENLNDFVVFIQNELIKDVYLALDNDILKGNGTAPTMKGLQHSDYYTAAAIPGNYELPSGITPNEGHVLRAIITQMMNGYANAGAILMHPTDTMKLDLSVDKDGQPILFPFASRDNTQIKGVPIIEHAGLTEGTFHVIDPTKIALFIQRGMTIRTWDQVDNDPLFDLMTVTASIKAGVRVKSNEKIGNIYGNFATLKAAMTAGS